MKLPGFFISLCMLMLSVPKWETNMAVAKEEAQEQHKLILLNFSGSDWCGPCIRMEKEIFENSTFNEFADASLVLVKADFPRLKKNRLSEEMEHENERLAARYNTKGIFPLTVLVDANGQVLKSWEGLPKQTAGEFVKEIDAVLHANSHG
jgi:thioredoxin-related protein